MTSQRTSRVLARVLVLVGVCTSSTLAVTCREEGECTTQHRIQRINWFFDRITPKTAGPLFTIKDMVLLMSQQIEELKILASSLSETPSEVRQYYGATGYGNYYGTTGYSGYGLNSAGSSSTSFNGLDAGLSALAFLAFGVWLFNLVLPQLQGAGLGLPVLRRRNAPQDNSGGVGSHDAQSPGILSNILSSSQDLVNNIFNKDTSRQSKRLTVEWSGNEPVSQARDTLMSPSDNTGEPTRSTKGDLVRMLENLSKQLVVSGLQQGNKPATDSAREPSSVLQGPLLELSNQNSGESVDWKASPW